jgi:hypothetical protein
MDVGVIMFAEFVGFLLALCLFGLPLAIIGLFILSIIDQSDKRTVESNQSSHLSDPKRVGWSNARIIMDSVSLRKRGSNA